MGWTARMVGGLSGSDQGSDARHVSRLIAIIDEYKDRSGQPSDASIGRAIGVARQTVSSWRRRGISELPDRGSLVRLAELTGRDYEDEVLRAALLDTGWLSTPAAEVSTEAEGA